jgi:GNAT superfamily N-acetyltransferase
MMEILLDVPGVRLVKLHKAHIKDIIKLMNREGWYYYDHHELKRYISLNQDCFTLFRHGEIVESIFTTNYGNQAWIGNIVIAKEARGQGLAARMIRRVIDYLREYRHVRTFRLDSVPLAIGPYKKVRFHAEAFTTSQEVELPLRLEFEAVNLEENLQVEKVKEEGYFSEGPDHAYRLGPSTVLPRYGISGFQALFQKATGAVNDEARELGGSARMYAVFPKSAKRELDLKLCCHPVLRRETISLDGQIAYEIRNPTSGWGYEFDFNGYWDIRATDHQKPYGIQP